MVLTRIRLAVVAAIVSLAGCQAGLLERSAGSGFRFGPANDEAARRLAAEVAAEVASEVVVEDLIRLDASCRAGSSDACLSLARVTTGDGARGSVGTWLPSLLEACTLDGKKCIALGDALIGRRANASEPGLAALAYWRACEHGHPAACYELGVLLYLGLGVEVDDELAARLHHEACENGVPEGCAYLAHLHARGFGVEQDDDLAAHYRRVACEVGFEDACPGPPGTRRPPRAEGSRPPGPSTWIAIESEHP